MPVDKLMYKDKDGFRYKFPERSCKKCQCYPCLENMHILFSNFAAFGCRNFKDVNTFEVNER